MTEETYIEKVKVYLSQELPEPYNRLITIKNLTIFVVIPDSVKFIDGYKLLHPLIETSINRIRNREYDLNFTIWSPNQLRDFKIYK